MAYIPELEPNEKLSLQIAFKVSEKAVAFNFAVSDQALYWPAIKTFVLKGDPTYFNRIRNNEISEVRVRRLPAYGFWIIAALMVAAGLTSAVAMMLPLINQEPGTHTVSGWPFAIFVGGILLPFAARGRLGLEVRTHDKKFRWNAPASWTAAALRRSFTRGKR